MSCVGWRKSTSLSHWYSIWTKVLGHLQISSTWRCMIHFAAPTVFHSSQKAFCKVLGCDCRKSPKERLWLQTWMLNETAWLAISILVHPKGVRWGWGQGTVQASQVLPHPKSSNIVFIWTFNSYTVAHLCWNRKGPSPKCSCRVGSTKIVQDIVVSWSINYPLYWN